jgi:glutamate synthase domain-containing protein 3
MTPPELWILKNTGSFSFEFMGGGIAVVCGYDSEQFESVLGDRGCVGMVGGTIYVRGPVTGLSHLSGNWIWTRLTGSSSRTICRSFWTKSSRPHLLAELTDFSQWKKIVAMTWEERQRQERITMSEFRTRNGWRAASFRRGLR